MRKNPKFKIYSKNKSFLLNCPQKLLKFKHSKWKIYKTKANKNLRRTYFFNNSLISPKLKQWDKKRLFFKNNLVIRRNLYQLFDTAIKLKRIKKIFDTNKVSKFNYLVFLNQSLLKSEFDLAILLSRLNFFSNIYESRKLIDNGSIYVNNNTVSHNYFLKKGDIISFKNFLIDFDKVLKGQIKTAIFIPFVEIDFYTNTIVIIKDLEDLSLEDLSLFTCKHNDLSKLRNALYRS